MPVLRRKSEAWIKGKKGRKKFKRVTLLNGHFFTLLEEGGGRKSEEMLIELGPF